MKIDYLRINYLRTNCGRTNNYLRTNCGRTNCYRFARRTPHPQVKHKSLKLLLLLISREIALNLSF